MSSIASISVPYERKHLLEPMLTLTEAAALLGVSESMLRKLTKVGHFPCIRLGKAVRVRVADLKALTEGRL